MYLWWKAWHIIAVTAWFAGLFYLPRLFVYHAMCTDEPGLARFRLMEHKLYWYIMTPSALLTAVFGLVMLIPTAWQAFGHQGWLHVKLTLVLLLYGYHGWCGWLVYQFARQRNTRSHRWYRLFNEVPTLLLVGIVILVVVKPF